MGYYSDVAIQCEEKAYEEIIRVATENKMKPDKILISDCDDYKLYILHWNWVKWYETFEEVNAIMNVLKEIHKIGYGYAFSRVGEDDGDTEYKFNNSDLVIYERRELDLPQEGDVWRCITAAIQ